MCVYMCVIILSSEIVDLIFPDHVIAYIPYLQEIGVVMYEPLCMRVCIFFSSFCQFCNCIL